VWQSPDALAIMSVAAAAAAAAADRVVVINIGTPLVSIHNHNHNHHHHHQQQQQKQKEVVRSSIIISRVCPFVRVPDDIYQLIFACLDARTLTLRCALVSNVWAIGINHSTVMLTYHPPSHTHTFECSSFHYFID
jgi:hypothetical protein